MVKDEEEEVPEVKDYKGRARIVKYCTSQTKIERNKSQDKLLQLSVVALLN